MDVVVVAVDVNVNYLRNNYYFVDDDYHFEDDIEKDFEKVQ